MLVDKKNAGLALDKTSETMFSDTKSNEKLLNTFIAEKLLFTPNR